MDSNRSRVSIVRETSLGVLPATPRMRPVRTTGESLAYAPTFFTPDEIRADRMNADPAQIGLNNRGGINYELSYPHNLQALSELTLNAMYSPWALTPEWDDNEVAGSVGAISTNVITVTDLSGSGGFAGTAVKANHLLRSSGWATGANNGVFKVASSTATSITLSGLTNEGASNNVRLKVVGFEGNSGDITATATGLGSTALNFTTLGLVVGQWVKIGDASNAIFGFANAANNGWARITGISATALTLDNLPSGWATDAGTGKTIRVFFGDVIKNGTTRASHSVERSFLGQTVPTHILHLGMVASRWTESMTSGRAITGSYELMGLSASSGTTPNGNSYDTPGTHGVMTANVSVGRIGEAGALLSSPNWARRLDWSLDNNLRGIEALGTVGFVEMGVGEAAVTGTIETYFGSNALYTKLLAGTPSNLSARIARNNQAVVRTFPRVTFTDGSPNAGGKNQDVTLPLAWTASADTATSCVLQTDRLEYFN